MRLWSYLRWIALLQGVGAILLMILDGSKLSKYVFLNTDASEQLSLFVNYALAMMLGFLVLILWWRPIKIGLLLLSAVFVLEALLTSYLGGSYASGIAPFAHSMRYGWPIAFLILLYEPQASRLALIGWRLLLGIIGITFIAHGIEALLHHPKFIDYLIVTSDRLTAWRFNEAVARALLWCIGTVDILVALWLFWRPNRAVLWYMGGWGLITAAARITYAGWNGVPDFFLRAPHYMLPFFAAWVLQYAGRFEWFKPNAKRLSADQPATASESSFSLDH